MTRDAGARTLEWTRWLRPRSVSWAGSMFIAVIAATAVYDVLLSTTPRSPIRAASSKAMRA